MALIATDNCFLALSDGRELSIGPGNIYSEQDPTIKQAVAEYPWAFQSADDPAPRPTRKRQSD